MTFNLDLVFMSHAEAGNGEAVFLVLASSPRREIRALAERVEEEGLIALLTADGYVSATLYAELRGEGDGGLLKQCILRVAPEAWGLARRALLPKVRDWAHDRALFASEGEGHRQYAEIVHRLGGNPPAPYGHYHASGTCPHCSGAVEGEPAPQEGYRRHTCLTCGLAWIGREETAESMPEEVA